MATSALPTLTKETMSKLDAQLTCAICLDRYTDPRILLCHHAFCKDCITHLPEYMEKERRTVMCPSCRKPTQLGEEGASALLPAFFVNGLLDIDGELKKTTEFHKVCSEHDKQEDIYCETCDMHICFKCTIGKHHGHQYDLANDLFETHEQEIKDCLKSVDERIDEVTRTLAVYDKTEKEIQDQNEAVQEEIDQSIQHQLQSIMDELHQSGKALHEQAMAATHQKLQLHALERAEVETILAQLKSCKDFVEEELRSRSQHQIQTARKKLVQRITDTHSTVKVSELQPGQKANTAFSKPPPQILDIGSVTSTQNYQSVRGLFSVDIPQLVLARQATEISLITVIPLPAESLSCTLLLESTSRLLTPQSCQVVKVDEGHFKAVLEPKHCGPHLLDVKINGDKINGSPFAVPVMSTSLAVAREKALKVFVEGLQHPYGVAVTDDGQHVIVTEREQHCVTVLSTAGEVVERFGQHGTGPGNFVNPSDVAVSADNHIYVKDDNTIQKFTLEGQHVASFTESAEAQFGHGMAVVRNGKLLTCSLDNKIIYEISSDLKQLKYFRTTMSNESRSYSIAVDTSGVVYVVMNDLQIYRYTSWKKPIPTNDSRGDRLHHLQNPFSVCVDTTDNTTCLYITDECQVKMFTTNGEFLGSFGGHHKLHGIAVSKAGDLYICNANGEVITSSIQKD